MLVADGEDDVASTWQHFFGHLHVDAIVSRSVFRAAFLHRILHLHIQTNGRVSHKPEKPDKLDQLPVLYLYYLF